MKAWLITDGSAGMIAQARALALALGSDYEIKTVMLSPWLRWLPNSIIVLLAKYIALPAALAQPYPDLVISCGRKGAAVAMVLKKSSLRAKRSNPALDRHGSASLAMTKFIHIGDPYISPAHFEAVIAMAHDKISANNVIKTRFALHEITPVRLAEAAEKFAPVFAPYPKPRIAVLLGGSTNKYKLETAAMRELIGRLQEMAAQGSLLITPSRRTGAQNMALLDSSFRGNDKVFLYDGTSENPYLGMLACADYIAVTNDSVNMMTDAVATGKPIYILPLPGHIGSKPTRFAESLVQDGFARLWEGKLEHWQYAAGDEMAEVARRVREMLKFCHPRA